MLLNIWRLHPPACGTAAAGWMGCKNSPRRREDVALVGEERLQLLFQVSEVGLNNSPADEALIWGLCAASKHSELRCGAAWRRTEHLEHLEQRRSAEEPQRAARGYRLTLVCFTRA